MKKRNIFNIPANFGFFGSFLSWISLNFAKDDGDLTIIFPNRRSCREFSALCQENGLKFPKIKALGDINLEDFLQFKDSGQIISEIKEIKRISDIDFLFFLSEEILKTEIFRDIEFNKAFSLATTLKDLFDDATRQDVEIEKLYNVDDSNLSRHRQFNLEFLKQFYHKIKNATIKNNLYDDVAFEAFVINRFCDLIKKQGLPSSFVIAGSSGSVEYGKKLIKAISDDKKGFVVLHGLNQNYQVFDDQKDPQFILNQLLQFIDITKDDVIAIKDEKYRLSSDERLDFVAFSNIPSEKTYLWHDAYFSKNLAEDFQENFSYHQAKNEIEEASIVAKKACEFLNQNKKTAIIVNSHEFAKLLKSSLSKLNLSYSDTRSLDLTSSKIINFIFLLTELFENDFESSTLLAILKHELCIFSQNPDLKKLEIEVLRSQRIDYSLSGILHKLDFVSVESKVFFEEFYQKIAQIKFSKGQILISQFLTEIIEVCQNLSGKIFADLLEQEPAKEEIEKIITKLASYKNLRIKSSEIGEFLQKIFAQISYFEQNDGNALIQIVSSIEARLLNFDALIIPCLNKGEFPQIQADNWLGKKIRKELEIDLIAKKYGQNSYDFCNYLANKEIFLTRTILKNGALSQSSPFLSRLIILLKKINFEFEFNDEVKKTQFVSSQIKQLAKVPLSQRPQRFATTEIAKLISDPYQIYAKKILKLKELDKIDYQPTNREFGSFVHEVLEKYIKTKEIPDLFYKYFLNDEAKLIWLPKFENIMRNFLIENENLKTSADYVEIKAESTICETLLTAKIDRISLDEDGKIMIFDYKTGHVPSKKDVFLGFEPQLVLYALMIENGSISFLKDKEISSLNYWKVSSFQGGGIFEIVKNDKMKDLLSQSKKDLEELLQFYKNEENYYKISLNQSQKHEYSHLERIF